MDDFGNDLGHYFYPDDDRGSLHPNWVRLLMANLVSFSTYGGLTGDMRVDA